jgi:hypothetical protein
MPNTDYDPDWDAPDEDEVIERLNAQRLIDAEERDQARAEKAGERAWRLLKEQGYQGAEVEPS